MRAQIRELVLRQRAGELKVAGAVDFEPLAWDVSAKAQGFDPGAFLADWNGKIDLDFAHARADWCSRTGRHAAHRGAVGNAARPADFRGRYPGTGCAAQLSGDCG